MSKNDDVGAWEPDWEEALYFVVEPESGESRYYPVGTSLARPPSDALREYHRQLMAQFGPLLEWARIDHQEWLDSQEAGYGTCSACNGPYMACECGAPTVLQKRRQADNP